MGMAIENTNTRIKKGSKNRAKQKDTFSKKVWYTLSLKDLPQVEVGKTLLNKVSTNLANVKLLGRTFRINQADLTESEVDFDRLGRVFEFKVTKVEGNNCISSFNGFELTSDKKKNIIRKWHSLIEACKDIEISDGHLLRVFVVGVTKKTGKRSYAKSNQKKEIRRIMFNEVEELKSKSIGEVIELLSSNYIGQKVTENVAKNIIVEDLPEFGVQDVHVLKVKVLKRP